MDEIINDEIKIKEYINKIEQAIQDKEYRLLKILLIDLLSTKGIKVDNEMLLCNLSDAVAAGINQVLCHIDSIESEEKSISHSEISIRVQIKNFRELVVEQWPISARWHFYEQIHQVYQNKGYINCPFTHKTAQGIKGDTLKGEFSNAYIKYLSEVTQGNQKATFLKLAQNNLVRSYIGYLTELLMHQYSALRTKVYPHLCDLLLTTNEDLSPEIKDKIINRELIVLIKLKNKYQLKFAPLPDPKSNDKFKNIFIDNKDKSYDRINCYQDKFSSNDTLVTIDTVDNEDKKLKDMINELVYSNIHCPDHDFIIPFVDWFKCLGRIGEQWNWLYLKEFIDSHAKDNALKKLYHLDVQKLQRYLQHHFIKLIKDKARSVFQIAEIDEKKEVSFIHEQAARKQNLIHLLDSLEVLLKSWSRQGQVAYAWVEDIYQNLLNFCIAQQTTKEGITMLYDRIKGKALELGDLKAEILPELSKAPVPLLADAIKVLEPIHVDLKKNLNQSSIYAIQQKYTQSIIHFLQSQLAEIEKMLGEPPCAFHILTLGSGSRHELIPGSDIDLAILIEHEEIQSDIYFKQLIYMFQTRLTHLPHQYQIPLEEKDLDEMFRSTECDFINPPVKLAEHSRTRELDSNHQQEMHIDPGLYGLRRAIPLYASQHKPQLAQQLFKTYQIKIKQQLDIFDLAINTPFPFPEQILADPPKQKIFIYQDNDNWRYRFFNAQGEQNDGMITSPKNLQHLQDFQELKSQDIDPQFKVRKSLIEEVLLKQNLEPQLSLAQQQGQLTQYQQLGLFYLQADIKAYLQKKIYEKYENQYQIGAPPQIHDQSLDDYLESMVAYLNQFAEIYSQVSSIDIKHQLIIPLRQFCLNFGRYIGLFTPDVPTIIKQLKRERLIPEQFLGQLETQLSQLHHKRIQQNLATDDPDEKSFDPIDSASLTHLIKNVMTPVFMIAAIYYHDREKKDSNLQLKMLLDEQLLTYWQTQPVFEAQYIHLDLENKQLVTKVAKLLWPKVFSAEQTTRYEKWLDHLNTMSEDDDHAYAVQARLQSVYLTIVAPNNHEENLADSLDQIIKQQYLFPLSQWCDALGFYHRLEKTDDPITILDTLIEQSKHVTHIKNPELTLQFHPDFLKDVEQAFIKLQQFTALLKDSQEAKYENPAHCQKIDMLQKWHSTRIAIKKDIIIPAYQATFAWLKSEQPAMICCDPILAPIVWRINAFGKRYYPESYDFKLMPDKPDGQQLMGQTNRVIVYPHGNVWLAIIFDGEGYRTNRIEDATIQDYLATKLMGDDDKIALEISHYWQQRIIESVLLTLDYPFPPLQALLRALNQAIEAKDEHQIERLKTKQINLAEQCQQLQKQVMWLADQADQQDDIDIKNTQEDIDQFIDHQLMQFIQITEQRHRNNSLRNHLQLYRSLPLSLQVRYFNQLVSYTESRVVAEEKIHLYTLQRLLARHPNPDGSRILFSPEHPDNPLKCWQQDLLDHITQPDKPNDNSVVIEVAWYDPISSQTYTRYLKPEIRHQLMSPDEREFNLDYSFKRHRNKEHKQAQLNQRIVIPIAFDEDEPLVNDDKKPEAHAFFKSYPEMPIIHQLVQIMNQKISGVVLPATLCRFSPSDGPAYTVLISKALPEGSLLEQMKTHHRETPEQGIPGDLSAIESQLDIFSFTLEFLKTLLVRPEDGKFDNIGIETFKNLQGNPALRLVDIDPDHSLVDLFTLEAEDEKKQTEKSVKLNVKTAIYILSPMDQPMDPQAIEIFLNLDPDQIIEQTLAQMTDYQQAYVNDRGSSLLTKDQVADLSKNKQSYIDTSLNDKIVRDLYARWYLLRKELSRIERDLTHREFFKTVESFLSQFYPDIDHNVTADERFKQAMSTSNYDWPTPFMEDISSPISTLHVSKRVFAVMNPQERALERASWRKRILYCFESGSSTIARYIRNNKTLDPRQLQAKFKVFRHDYYNYRSLVRSIYAGDIKICEKFYSVEFLLSCLNMNEMHGFITEQQDLTEQEVEERFVIRQSAILEQLISQADASSTSYKLNLSGFTALDENTLVRLLEKFQMLMSLNVSNCIQLGNRAVIEIDRLCHYLRYLNLSGLPRLTRIAAPKPSRFALNYKQQPLLNFYALEELIVNNCKNLREIDINAPKSYLSVKACSKLTYVHTQILPQEVLSKVWWKNQPNLEEIKGIPCEIIKKLVVKIKEGRLNVDSNNCGNFPWSKWVPFLSLIQGIRCLDIKTENLDQESIQAWIEIIEKNESIEEVTIDGQLVKSARSSQLHIVIFDLGYAKIKLISTTLKKNPNLKSLSLDFNHIEHYMIEYLTNVLGKHQNLKRLSLPWLLCTKAWWENHPRLETINGLSILAIKNFVMNIQENIQGGRLNVDSNNCGNVPWSKWVSFLSQTQEIRWLDIKTENLAQESIQAWTEIIEKSEAIEKITIDGQLLKSADYSNSRIKVSLQYRNLRNAKIQLISVALKKHPHLIILDLDCNDIDSEEAKALVPVFKNLTNLGVLCLSSNSISLWGAKTLVPVLKRLTNVLCLRTKAINPEETKCLTPVLEMLTNFVEVLWLRSNVLALEKITNLEMLRFSGPSSHYGHYDHKMDDDLKIVEYSLEVNEYLASVFENLTNLRELNLGGTYTTWNTWNIEDLIAKLQNLEVLNLGHNYYGFEAVTFHLAPALEKMTNLKNLRELNLVGIFIEELAPKLAKLTSLTALHLKHNINPDKAEVLASALEQLRNLVELNLGSIHKDRGGIGPDGAKVLVPMFQKLTNLKVLNLERNHIRDEGAKELARELANLTKLEVLNLDDNNIWCEGAEALALVFAKLTNFRKLNLDGDNHIGPKGAQALVWALEKLPHLEELRLDYQYVGPEGAKALAPLLAKLTNLKSVWLENHQNLETINGIPCKTIRKLAANIHEGVLKVNSNDFGGIPWSTWVVFLSLTPEMKKLDIEIENLDQANILNWAKIIEINEAIEEIIIDGKLLKDGQLLKSVRYSQFQLGVSFQGRELSDAKVQLISAVIKKQSNLQNLNLSGNQIGDAGTIGLAGAIKLNKHLQSLNLSHNRIGNAGAKALELDVLMENMCLQRLDLKWNQIGDDGAKSLGGGLVINMHLQRLYLGYNQIGDKGVVGLADWLKYSIIELQHLDLSHNFISNGGAKALGDMLKRNKHLQILDLSHNSIGDDGAIELAMGNKYLQRLYLDDNLIGDKIANLLKSIHDQTYISLLDNPKTLTEEDEKILHKSNLAGSVISRTSSTSFFASSDNLPPETDTQESKQGSPRPSS